MSSAIPPPFLPGEAARARNAQRVDFFLLQQQQTRENERLAMQRAGEARAADSHEREKQRAALEAGSEMVASGVPAKNIEGTLRSMGASSDTIQLVFGLETARKANLKEQEARAGAPQIAENLATEQLAGRQASPATATGLAQTFESIPAELRPLIGAQIQAKREALVAQARAQTPQQRGEISSGLAADRAGERVQVGKQLVTNSAFRLEAASPSEFEAVKNQVRDEIARHFGNAEVEWRMAQAEIEADALRFGNVGKLSADRAERNAQIEQLGLQGVRPRLQSLAIAGKAFKDPLTDLVAPGGASQRDKAAVRAGLYTAFVNMDIAAREFAKKVGGTPVTGLVEDLAKRFGNETPEYGAFEVFRRRFQQLLQKAQSGAVLNETEIRQIESLLPENAQLTFANGNLGRATRLRFDSIFRTLEQEHLSLLERPEHGEAIKRLRAVRNAERQVAQALGFDDWVSGAVPGVESPLEGEDAARARRLGLD